VPRAPGRLSAEQTGENAAEQATQSASGAGVGQKLDKTIKRVAIYGSSPQIAYAWRWWLEARAAQSPSSVVMES